MLTISHCPYIEKIGSSSSRKPGAGRCSSDTDSPVASASTAVTRAHWMKRRSL
jgi:hypothetical protein